MVKKRQRGGAAGGVDGGEGDAGHASSRSSKRVRFPEELAEEKEVTGNGPATGADDGFLLLSIVERGEREEEALPSR
jgi:hypothetical protein